MSLVKGSKIGITNFARLYLGVLITERIGLNLGILSITGLWTFWLPYRILSLEPTGQILSNSSLMILLLWYKLLKTFLNFFSTSKSERQIWDILQGVSSIGV